MARRPARIRGSLLTSGAPRPAAERPSSAGLLAPGSMLCARLPSFRQWHVDAKLPGHSCGGSAGMEPASLLGLITQTPMTWERHYAAPANWARVRVPAKATVNRLSLSGHLVPLRHSADSPLTLDNQSGLRAVRVPQTLGRVPRTQEDDEAF